MIEKEAAVVSVALWFVGKHEYDEYDKSKSMSNVTKK